MAMTDSHTPMFSFVVAVYNVEAYLGDFLASIDALDVSPDDLELIFVDDGSVDGSSALVDTWISCTRFAARQLHKCNGGPGSARNAGLACVHGRWVSFPDPDDVLAPDYLRVVAAYADCADATGVAMIAARPIRFLEDGSSRTPPHALDFRYLDVERVVDLGQSTRFIQLHVNTGFYRTELIRAKVLRFDEDVRPVFEDAVFNVEYLTQAARPTIAFLRGASYFLRIRADAGSLTGSKWRDAAMFDRLPEKGYLALLERSGRPVPRWIQNTVYYDLQWYFKTDARLKSDMSGLTQGALENFHRLLGLIVERLDEATLLEFHAIDIPVRTRLSLMARKCGRIPEQSAYVTKLDYAQRIMQVSYFTTEAHPHEEIRLDGAPVPPAYAKTTSIRYFDRTWLYQRDLWLPSQRPVSLRVAGRPMPIVYGAPAAALFETSPREVWRRYAGESPPRPGTSRARPPSGADPDGTTSATDPRADLSWASRRRPLLRGAQRRWREQTSRATVRLGIRVVTAAGWSLRLVVNGVIPVIPAEAAHREGFVASVRRRASTPAVRRRYRGAWVIMDRDSSAQDNGEAFYSYLLQHHPEVNAWFALSRGSPDWTRLESEGFRLIEFGSVEYALALRNALYLISSQADDYLVRPGRPIYGPPTWKFVFLQHGVIHNDISRWLNTRRIRLMITTTEAEHLSIVADGTPYRLSEKEVARTGLPRHDRLLAKCRDLPHDRRRTLLVTPTWRDFLLAPQGAGHRRELSVELATSPFFEGWQRFLTSPDLVRLLDREGLDLVFMAHPHLQEHMTARVLPPHVRTVTLHDTDIQEVIARARVLVTDYSSIAFDAAFLGTPVVYYQFDADEFFSGRHTVRAGAFSYRRDGFGPVVDNPTAAVAALADLLDPASPRLAEYQRRMARTFTFHDGRCCERVYAAIRSRELPHPHTCEGRTPHHR